MALNLNFMNTFPFNAEGVKALLQTLYALPDEELLKEADALANDYRGWLSNHFILNQRQLDFLQGIDDRFIAKAGPLTQSFLVNRLPITLIKPESAAESTQKDGEGKLIDIGKKSSISYSDEGGFNSVEDLTYTISYSANL
jgi:hypothetical protein